APLASAPPFRRSARLGEKCFADIGLMRDAGDDTLAVVERNQRRPVHLSEDEAARAVDRIDDPCIARGTGLPAQLLAANAVVGKKTRDTFAAHRLSRAIGDGHRIVTAHSTLVGNVE